MNRYFLASLLLPAMLTPAAASPTTAPGASAWEIGPVIRGRNYSQGMPPRPIPAPRGWYFDFPVGSAAAGHVHYVTFRPGPMSAKSRIVVRYRIDARHDTRFVAQENPAAAATVSVSFQRRGDNWGAKGRYQFYRWYAPVRTVREIAPGEQEISIALDDPEWVSVQGHLAGSVPGEMAAALRDVERIGLVFGSLDGRGHGVFATQPARFTLLDFRIL